ncbi:HD domain-containing phosphohydrolase [Dehalogenimonas sp. THU2]|uniref:response regulator n=1 Tax=Dehalogenimonas sp. THU2 TaxID=3151121 RepID=UPI0032186157
MLLPNPIKMAAMIHRDTILLVGLDEQAQSLLFSRLAAEGHRCLLAVDGVAAMEAIERQDIALVLLDINLPYGLGLQVLQEIKAKSSDTDVIMVTGGGDAAVPVECLRLGAYDYLTRPLNPGIVTFCAGRALEKRRLVLENRESKETLESKIAVRTREITQALVKLKSASIDTIMRLSRAAEFKDEDTGTHIQRMSRYTAYIAERMGLPDDYVETILYASTMHDIGKIGIPDNILLKPGKLDDEEWVIMKQHTVIGARILDGADAEVMRLGSAIAISHHEKWNGTGYPFGLKGEEIPLSGRIAAVADVFDSVTSKRGYRKTDFTPQEAFKLIEQNIGSQFDPAVFQAFKTAWPDIQDEQERCRRLETCRRQEMDGQLAAAETA